MDEAAGAPMNLGSITISYELDDDGDMITGVSIDGDLPIVTQLGLIELAKDTILRMDSEVGED